MNRELYQLAEADFERLTQSFGVDIEDALAFTHSRLNPDMPLDVFIETLTEISNERDRPATSDKDVLLCDTALLYAPLVRPDSLPHVLAGAAFAKDVAQNNCACGAYNCATRQYNMAPSPSIYSVFNNFPLDKLLSRRWGIDATEAIKGENTEEEEITWNMLTLAEIVHLAGDSAPRRLRQEFGIEYPGRYPIELLAAQLGRGALKRTVRELPIFVASSSDYGHLWQEEFYRQALKIASTSLLPLNSTIYEVKSRSRLLNFMASVHQPAMGIINSHGNWDNLYLGDMRKGGDLEVEYLRISRNKPKIARIKEVWRGAAGLAILSCHAGDLGYGFSYGNRESCIGLELANAASVPVIAAKGEAREVKMVGHARSGRLVVRVAISSDGHSSARKLLPNKQVKLRPTKIDLRAA